MIVEISTDNHIAEVRLNRPESLNAINREMDEALAEAWQHINADPDIWCVILSASGERAFSIGADLSEPIGNKARMALGGGLTGIGGPLTILEKPMVAAVQGYCVGGGFELAMCADIIVAADTAQFGLPETKVGVIGECGVVHRVVRQLPYHIAMQLVLTGERIDASDARSYGLVNEVVSSPDLASAARKWASKLNAASPLAVRAAKEAVNNWLGHPLSVALSSRSERIEDYARSDDIKEGDMARAERRKPLWKGR